MDTRRLSTHYQMFGFEYLEQESAERQSRGFSAWGTEYFIKIPSGRLVSRIREIMPAASTIRKEFRFGIGAIGEVVMAVIKTPQEKKIDPKEQEQEQEQKIIDFEAAKKRREQLDIELERARSEKKFKEVMRLSGQPITQEQMASAGYSNTSFDASNIDGIGKVCQIVDFRKWQMEKKQTQVAQASAKGNRIYGADMKRNFEDQNMQGAG